VLSDPTLLFILFIVAAICLYVELAHPGAIVPGTIGALALLLFIIGSFSIQPNWAGFLLMALAIVLLAVDVRAPTHGILTVGALVSLVFGSLIFFDSGSHSGATGVSPIIIVSFAVAVGVVSLIVLRFAIAAQLRRVTTGKESYIGQSVTVIEALNPTGRVRLLGENWQARLDARHAQPDIRSVPQPTSVGGASAGAPPSTPIAAAPGLAVGARARVVGVEGLTLIVEPKQA
jgi:membrane-bound serine protease (ClpP class)